MQSPNASPSKSALNLTTRNTIREVAALILIFADLALLTLLPTTTSLFWHQSQD